MKSDRIISLGPTIPYIIGAYKIYNGYEISIGELLDEVINSKAEEIGLIQKCPDIGEYVLYLNARDICNRFMTKEINLLDSEGYKGLIITQNAKNLGTTAEKVLENLNYEYENYIKGNRFSWSKKENTWLEFTDRQKEYIKNIV